MMYARRFYWLLWAGRGEALRVLASVSPNVAAKALAALRRLSEFLEVEEEWLPRARWLRRRLRRRLEGVLPGSGLPKYLRVDTGFVERLLEAASLLPGRYRLFAGFMLSTGLRVSHALYAWRRYGELLVERWGVPHLVLNMGSGKRAWIALLTPELSERLPRRARLGMSYTGLRMRWRRHAHGSAWTTGSTGSTTSAQPTQPYSSRRGRQHGTSTCSRAGQAPSYSYNTTTQPR